jgi:hypothetical protein
MKLKRLSMSAAAASVALVIAGTAIAQGPGPMWGEGWGMWWSWGRGPEGMLDRVEGRLAFIKQELQITEAQMPAWNKLADDIRATAKSHNARMRALVSSEGKAKTLPERLDAQEQLISARLEEIKQIKGSLNALYGQLSDAQKKEADDIVLPMAGMGGRHWWRR